MPLIASVTIRAGTLFRDLERERNAVNRQPIVVEFLGIVGWLCHHGPIEHEYRFTEDE